MQTKPLIWALLMSIALSSAAWADAIIYDPDRNLTWLANTSASQELNDGWTWMGKYRVWDANRKVFLFAENWLSPEIRDDKNAMFRDSDAEGGMTGDAPDALSVYDWDFAFVIPLALATYLSSQDGFADASIWASTEYEDTPAPNYAWYYDTYVGNQNAFIEDNGHYVWWAVRIGDVAAVPEPTTLLLVGLGLASLGAMRRRG